MKRVVFWCSVSVGLRDSRRGLGQWAVDTYFCMLSIGASLESLAGDDVTMWIREVQRGSHKGKFPSRGHCAGNMRKSARPSKEYSMKSFGEGFFGSHAGHTEPFLP